MIMTINDTAISERECVKKTGRADRVVLLSRRADPSREIGDRLGLTRLENITRLLEKGHQSGIIRVQN
ncbi:hypothetical protein ACNKHX_09670 [Shigella flexneri]